MPLLKKTIMWAFFLAAMYFGGSGVQSASNFFQGMGFVSILMALICLYILFKLIWRPLGSYMKTALVLGVMFFCAYSIGLFDGNTLHSFLTGAPTASVPVQSTESENIAEVEELSAQMFSDVNTEAAESLVREQAAQQAAPAVNDGGLVEKVKTFLFGNQQQGAQQGAGRNINPLDYPEIRGVPQVLSGSILAMNGLKIKLFGIDAPDPSQTCANRSGGGYNCGQEAILWLQNWLGEKEISCRILSKVERGWVTGACFADEGKYDVAAVVVNAGWAVAYTQNTRIYVPYEQQAAEAHRGLWRGEFYKPWDWRKMQNRKVKIKINAPKQTNKKSGKFWGLF